MNTKEIRSKLSEAESDLEASEQQLKNSLASKGRLITQGNATMVTRDRYDGIISEAKVKIETLGGIIESLKAQLPIQEEKEEAEKKLRDTMLNNLEPAIKKKSAQFLKNLQKALELNKKILAFHGLLQAIER